MAFINNAKADDTYYTVVISSVKSAQSAQKLADDMIKKGFEANVMLVNLNNGTTNRVCIGKSTTKDAAEEIQRKLAKAGYSSSWIAVINGADEQKAVAKKLPEKKPVTSEIETYTVDVVTSEPIAKKEKVAKTEVSVITKESVAEKNTAIATKKEASAIPTPPDVDKLPLAVPKEFSGNRVDYTADTKSNDVVIYNIKVGQADDKTSGTTVYEILSEGNQPITVDTLTTITANSNDIVVYHIGVGNEPVNTATATSIITTTNDSQIMTNDVLITSTDVIVSPGTVTTYEFITQADPNIISDEVLITRNERFPIKTNSADSLVILKAAPEAKAIQSQPLKANETEAVVIHTVNAGTSQPETPPITTQHLTVASISPVKSDVSVKPIESEKNPKLESLIPGTNLSYSQFYTEIKKIFYALEKYSLASGTLLNEYIDPTYGTYIRYRNNEIVDYEKMVKPKDIYKNPQVKSNVLMFFQDMVKVRRQPPVVEQLPKYDCALKHVPGLNIYLSSLAKDNKFYEETVKCLNSDDTALTDIETTNILEANKSINAAFAIGSSELVKAVYFAVEGDKVYIRYIDMYDNCEKK